MSMHFDADDLPTESHEINVTPFIDVMLVLLIIFMVCAPLATVTLPVNLPSASAAAPPPETPVFVTLRADQQLAVNDDVTAPGALPAALAGATKGDQTQRIFLRADGAVSYTALMQLMDQLRSAGYLRISLVALDRPAP